MGTKLYDVLIVGNNKVGLSTLKKLIALNLTIGVVNNDLKNIKNIKYDVFNTTIVYITYKRGLIYSTLETGEVLVSKNLIFATESTPKIKLSYDYVSYNKFKLASQQSIIIYITDMLLFRQAIKQAIKISEKKVRVTVCCPFFVYLDKAENLAPEIKKNKYITILNNTKIINYINKQVFTDTFSTINCDALIVFTSMLPNTNISNNIINLTDQKKFMTTNTGVSTIVPNVFAVGECAEHAVSANTIISQLKI